MVKLWSTHADVKEVEYLNNNILDENSLKSLALDVYLIWYANDWEGSIIILKDNNTIYYSAVVDCYGTKEINKTDEELKSILWGKKLDALIWTHLHHDHSNWLSKIIERHCDKNTEIYIPTDIIPWEKLTEIGTKFNRWWLSKKSKRLLDEIRIEINKKFCVINPIGVATKTKLLLKQIVFSDPRKITPLFFEVICMSPITKQTNKQWVINKNDLWTNIFSISLFIKFGYFRIFLWSDVENTTIGEMDISELKNLHYIKIPHHGSLTASDILKNLNFADYAFCTTKRLKKKQYLPVKDVIDWYYNKSITTWKIWKK